MNLENKYQELTDFLVAVGEKPETDENSIDIAVRLITDFKGMIDILAPRAGISVERIRRGGINALSKYSGVPVEEIRKGVLTSQRENTSNT